MAWAKNGTPDTLTGAGELEISDLTAKKFHKFMEHGVGISANNDIRIILDNDATGSEYATRRNTNGGADGTLTSRDYIQLITSQGAQDHFTITDFVNIDGEEALCIMHSMQAGSAGAGNAPNRMENVAKTSRTTQFTVIDVFTSSTATMAADSNLSAIGSD
jgi:hypothetical protein